MKKLKLSPWHSGDVNPVHVGWYQVKGTNFPFNPGVHGKGKGFSAWRKWNGCDWLWVDDYNVLGMAGMFSTDKWRGVLK